MITLQLKTRSDSTSISVPLKPIQEVLRLGATEGKDALWQYFSSIKDLILTHHDREWLEAIVNYVDQQKPQPLTEQVKWFKLAAKVGKLVWDSAEVALTKQDVDLMWSRMCDGEFKPRIASTAWAEFILEFCSATGKQFSTITKDEEEISTD